MVMSPVDATFSERLEAAAISMKTIAAKDPGAASFLATLAFRFGVDEQVLHCAAQSPATQRIYDRIHSNTQPVLDLWPMTRAPADASSA